MADIGSVNERGKKDRRARELKWGAGKGNGTKL